MSAAHKGTVAETINVVVLYALALFIVISGVVRYRHDQAMINRINRDTVEEYAKWQHDIADLDRQIARSGQLWHEIDEGFRYLIYISDEDEGLPTEKPGICEPWESDQDDSDCLFKCCAPPDGLPSAPECAPRGVP